MDIRYTVGLIFISVGALIALLGVGALVAPNGNLELRLGCGAAGLVGVLLVVLGLRLRNKAVTSSPALQQMLDTTGATSRTEAAKPSFLKGKTDTSDLPAVQSAEPPRGFFAYWVIAFVFGAAVLGLTVAVLDVFAGGRQFKVAVTVVGAILALFFPLVWMRRSRRAPSETNRAAPDDSSPGAARSDDDGK